MGVCWTLYLKSFFLSGIDNRITDTTLLRPSDILSSKTFLRLSLLYHDILNNDCHEIPVGRPEYMP